MKNSCIHQCDGFMEDFAQPHALGNLVEEVGLSDEMAGAGGIRSSGKDMIAFLTYAMDLKDSELQPAFEMSQVPNHEINELISIWLGWHIYTMKTGK